MNQRLTDPSREAELAYARTAAAAVRIGFVALLGSFLLYVSGWTTSIVPVEEIPRFWNRPVGEFVAATGWPTGWQWLSMLGSGDALSMAGIALLLAMSVVPMVRLLPAFLDARERAHAAIIMIQWLLVVLAAAGLLSRGG